jgi:hypothetical protein
MGSIAGVDVVEPIFLFPAASAVSENVIKDLKL